MLDAVGHPKSDTAVRLASRSPVLRNWPAWRGRARWYALIAVTALCLALARQGELKPAIMGAIFLASAVSSIAGFAFSAIGGAMLFHLARDPVQIVQVMIVCSIANQAAMVWAIRRAINWPELGIFLVGGAAGLPIGIAVLLKLDHHFYTRILGAFLLAYGGYMLIRKPSVCRRQTIVLDILSGFLGGITGGAVGFPGAFVTIWCGFKGWSKERQRAVFQPFILIMQVATLGSISLVRYSGGNVGFDPADLLCVPAGLLGTALGIALYGRLSDRHFARAVNLLLIISGISYLG